MEGFNMNGNGKSILAPTSQRGAALAAVLFLIVVMVTIAVGTMSSAMTSQKVMHNANLGKQALQIANAGLHDVLGRTKNTYSNSAFLVSMFDTELAAGGTSGLVADVGALVDLDNAGVNYRFANFGGAAASDGYYVRVIDNFDEVPNDATTDTDRWIEIVSIGRIATASREVRARLQGINLGWALYGKELVTISADAFTDSFDPNLGPYDPLTAGSDGNVGSNGDIDIGGTNTWIHGDATASGAISQPDHIDGVPLQGAPPQSLPSVLPCGGPFHNGSGVISGDYNLGNGKLKGDGANPVVELSPGTYCFSELTLSGASVLTITGPTTINLTGNSDLSGGGVINTTGNASDLSINSSGGALIISGGSDAYMNVYAPDTIVDISGGSQLTGSVVGRRVTLSGATQFHYDETLADSSDFALAGWREVVR